MTFSVSHNRKVSDIDLVMTLLALKKLGRVGRYELSKALDIGEGVARRILTILAAEELVVPLRYKGCKLTRKGEASLNDLLSKLGVVAIHELNAGFLKVGPVSTAVHLANKADKLPPLFRLRDAAVLAGADGLTVVVYKDSSLYVPAVDLRLDDCYDLYRKFEESFDLRENDVLVIGSGKNYFKALKGALAAAFLIQEHSKKVPEGVKGVTCERKMKFIRSTQ